MVFESGRVSTMRTTSPTSAVFRSSWAWSLLLRRTTFLYFGCARIVSTLTTIVLSPLSETTTPRRSWRRPSSASGFGRADDRLARRSPACARASSACGARARGRRLRFFFGCPETAARAAASAAPRRQAPRRQRLGSGLGRRAPRRPPRRQAPSAAAGSSAAGSSAAASGSAAAPPRPRPPAQRPRAPAASGSGCSLGLGRPPPRPARWSRPWSSSSAISALCLLSPALRCSLLDGQDAGDLAPGPAAAGCVLERAGRRLEAEVEQLLPRLGELRRELVVGSGPAGL